LARQNLEQNRSKRPKTQSTPPDPRTDERARTYLHTTPHTYAKPTRDLASTHMNLDNIPTDIHATDTLRKPYPTEFIKPTPKPYKLRTQRAQRAPNKAKKRKTHSNNPQEDYLHLLTPIIQTPPTIKHISVAQASPRINMAFPTPSVMPHRDPTINTTKYKQTTLEQ
jgi:hypothetical protein